ncbi:Cof-type HAD-IIB family hydrolase [Chryseobacterium sp. JUb7]|uniref:Cof-type HAD-IIB family hydrolase n=1 Tax=Chryseobacterium sp. JUb7 TaxID=2940599 RepID=UPI0021681355|nr:Cof-type HAD-IIB family hydrolase [Chryseobacterium sp. JUb7]MCS3528936.1 Cof subfamily protein (haloacid dehalogenase superfamily) [Chryseobacterium sp. JUb7]
MTHTDNSPVIIKAVFFDIDGTLISFKTNKIPESTQNSIKKLREKGIKVIVATGRSINTLAHISHIEFDGFITFNGGYCATTDGKILSKNTIDPNDIKGLINYAENSPLSYSLMYEDKVEINDATPEVVGMYAHVNLPVPPVHDKENIDYQNVLQANIFLRPEVEDEFMKTVMPNSIASRWTPLFADVNPSGISKQIGIEIFCDHFGIDVSETMAFGDGGNDITMLKFTKIGIAMGNANENVKEISDYITEEVDNDGIEKALIYFKLI